MTGRKQEGGRREGEREQEGEDGREREGERKRMLRGEKRVLGQRTRENERKGVMTMRKGRKGETEL